MAAKALVCFETAEPYTYYLQDLKGALTTTYSRNEAIQFALLHQYTHLVLVPCAYQKNSEEILFFTDFAVSQPRAVAVGMPAIVVEDAIKANKMSLHLKKLKDKYQSKLKITNPECNFRCYPIDGISSMNLIFNKQGSEFEILIRLIFARRKMVNIKVSGLSRDNPNLGFFEKSKTYLINSLLNTGVVVASLLTEKSSPAKTAFEVALGVFMGTTPFYGLHTGLCAGLAFIFKLNFIHLFLGTQISLPPLMPFLIFGSQRIGKYVFNYFNVKSSVAVTLISGSLILGFFLAIISFFAVYFLKRKLDKDTID